jgi:hypothetical protein
MAKTTIRVPLQIADYFRNNPLTLGIHGESVRLLPSTCDRVPGLEGRFVNNFHLLATVEGRPADHKVTAQSWAVAVRSALCRAYPVLDGLHYPAACIISAIHWTSNLGQVADYLEANAPANRTSPYEVTASGLRRFKADPGRWYKLILCPIPEAVPMVEALLAGRPAHRIDAVFVSRFLLVSCPAWDADALYPGLPVEDLV